MTNSELLSQARALPSGVLKLLDYADTYQPTATFVCDCDAHPIGKALEFLCEEQGRPFPSAGEAALYYRKISKKVPLPLLTEHLSDAFQRIVKLSPDASPKILVIDDHVSAGDTRYNFNRARQRLGVDANVKWITYTGKGVDYTCNPHIGPGALMSWRDRPDIIGVRYSAELEPVDCSTAASAEFYDAIRQGAHEAALSLPVLANTIT